MKTNILDTIEEKMPSLPKSEKKIAETILKYPKEVMKMNTTELAKKASSSSAAIIRFCRSIQVDGFTQLKILLSANLTKVTDEVYSDLIPNEPLDQIKKKILFNAYHVFDETNETLSNKNIEQAVQMIEEAEMIFTYGIGASGLVAQDIHQKLTRLGKNVMNSYDHHLLAAAIASYPTKALFIGISNSGEKKEVLDLANIAKKHQIPTLGLTQDNRNDLAKIVDVALLTASGREAPLRSAATSSLLTQLYTVDILFYSYATNKYEDTIEKLSVSKEAIDTFYEEKQGKKTS